MRCTNPKPAILTTQMLIMPDGELRHFKSFVKIINVNEFVLGKKTIFTSQQIKGCKLLTENEHVLLPCRRCIGDIINKANDWATRAIIEASAWSKNCFLTLTYDEKHLPKQRNLCKRDMQLFWKRLRKYTDGEETWTYKGKIKRPIRFFYSGEYGPKTHRPHYHAGVFNYWPKDAKLYKRSKYGDDYFTSETLNRIWGKGYVIIGRMEYASACYIARYTMKKLTQITKQELKKWILENETTGDEVEYLQQFLDEKVEQPKNKVKEFIETSRNGGIGLAGWIKDKDKIIKNLGIYVKNKNNGEAMLKKIPLFLKQKWAEANREEYITATQAERERMALLSDKPDWKKIDQIEEIQIKKANRLARTHFE